MLHLLPLLLIACSSGPAVTGLRPDRAAPGTALLIDGEGLPDELSVAFTRADGRGDTVYRVPVAGGARASVPVPELAPGTYTVSLRAEGLDLAAPRPLTVLDRPSEAACVAGWTTNTSVALTRGVVRVDRFDAAGVRDGVEIAIPDVVGVEYERARVDADGLCAVIWLRLADGRRVAFDQRLDQPLDDRARRLASDLGRPFAITRDDDAVAADARPN